MPASFTGDCDHDGQCEPGLICSQRNGNEAVHGCSGTSVATRDYCIAPVPDNITLTLYARNDCFDETCGRCEGTFFECATKACGLSCSLDKRKLTSPMRLTSGNCFGDFECGKGLKCFPRRGFEAVPGCKGAGLEGVNYCYEPNIPNALVATSSCTSASPCPICEGTCNVDSDCEGDLTCFLRSGSESVPGCVGGFGGDVAGTNYCHKPPPKGPVTYVPGDLTVSTAGLRLSTGLSARVVATEGQPVKYASGGQSSVPYHTNTDGGAVFSKPDGGWIYTANAEDYPGGVGSIHFDKNGYVMKYERVASSSNFNCGGGKTWWGTWITCEEYENGQVWEVDPSGKLEERQTLLGLNGGMFESFAYDRSNPADPKFFCHGRHL